MHRQMYNLPCALVVFVKSLSSAFLALLWLEYMIPFVGRIPSELFLSSQWFLKYSIPESSKWCVYGLILVSSG